ncbi:MAG: M48 family metalloprotease [Pseudomonadota bacterium]
MRFLVGMVLFLALLSCASTNVAPHQTGSRPEATSDEAGLWMIMDKAEEDLKTSSQVERDAQLNQYIREVTCRVVTDDACKDLRIYVIKENNFNASMAPNGMMLIHTGLLLRMENEAQLAYIIGHEFAHFYHRHSLEIFRHRKNVETATLALRMISIGSQPTDLLKQSYLQLTQTIYAFSRKAEREADAGGFHLMQRAGYDPYQAAEAWIYLMQEISASSSKRKKEREARASAYRTHPLTQDRVRTLFALAETHQGESYLGLDAYKTATTPFLEEWLDHDLVRRDLGEHLFLINHLLERGGAKGVLWYRKGEAYRIRRKAGDQERALAAYQRAIQFIDAPARTYREIGHLERRFRRHDAAKTAYQEYLRLYPNAPDRPLIEIYILH